MEEYLATQHLGDNPYLRLHPRRNTGTVVVHKETDDLEAFYEFGYAGMPHITGDLVKDGVIRVCLTEGDVPIELNMAIAGQLALTEGVQAVALEVIRPTSRTGYRIVITKDAEKFPLGSRIDKKS